MLDALARMPFADTLELAVILGQACSTMHRALTACSPTASLRGSTTGAKPAVNYPPAHPAGRDPWDDGAQTQMP